VVVPTNERAATGRRAPRFLHRHATVAHRIRVAPAVYTSAHNVGPTNKQEEQH